MTPEGYSPNVEAFFGMFETVVQVGFVLVVVVVVIYAVRKLISL